MTTTWSGWSGARAGALWVGLLALVACRTDKADVGETGVLDDGAADADGDGFTVADGDCDDADAAVNPGATESCNGVDDDCDGDVDEGVTTTFYEDADGDGWGDEGAPVEACGRPAGTAAEAGDCDDADAAVNPGATESCNGVDDDCDGDVDEADAVDAATWYADADGDGYGDAGAATVACEAPSGTVADATDCDDTRADVHPGAEEVCDEVDDDCDGDVDEGVTTPFYEDRDGDGWGDPGSVEEGCALPEGYAEVAGDCDDADAGVNPGATEVCDGVDDDCDGTVDEADAWWDTSFPYRLPVTLTAASTEVDSPPVAVDVDFRAALDALGDGGAFDADTLRVVVQDCDLGQPELPSQFLDGWSGVFAKADPSDPTGDEAGAVVFLADQDGDLATLEPFTAGDTLEVALYFGGSASAPSYATDLSASASSLSTDRASASFDEDAGGMLDALVLADTGTALMSQTESCCGNSIYTDAWEIDPQDDAGTLTLLEEGPVFAAVEATGSRSDALGGYDYTFTWWMFAGRPELYARVHEVTTVDTTVEHSDDYTHGIRPWESRQDAVSGASAATFTTDEIDYAYADVSDGTEGVAWAYVQAPAYAVGLANYDPYLIVVGNDHAPAGSGTPGTVPAGTAFHDHVVHVLLPHLGGWSDVEDELFGLVEGVTATAGTPEALSP